MKLIKRNEPPCPCMTKLWDFYQLNADQGVILGIGSVVECDCGTCYALDNSQFDGNFWKKVGRDATVTVII